MGKMHCAPTGEGGHGLLASHGWEQNPKLLPGDCKQVRPDEHAPPPAPHSSPNKTAPTVKHTSKVKLQSVPGPQTFRCTLQSTTQNEAVGENASQTCSVGHGSPGWQDSKQ